MKRAPKVLISLLLLAAMLGNLIPVFSLATDATDVGSFSYTPATTVTPGKEYLILSSNAEGTAYALAPANGASENNVTTTTSVAVAINSDGTISGSDATKSLEWEFIQSTPTTSDNRAKVLYMLQNKATGAYLWNPSYEVDTSVFGTCITPIQDAYNGSTFAAFDYNTALTAATGSENILGDITGTATFQGAWMKLQSPSNGDGNFAVNFQRSELSANTWRFFTYTFHPGLAAQGTTLTVGQQARIYTDTTGNPGFAQDYSFLVSSSPIQNGWNSPSLDLISFAKLNGASFFTGNIKRIRLDLQDTNTKPNQHGFVDSVALGKTAAGTQTLAMYRNDVANARGGGLMPSVEYPFCQFEIGNINNNHWAIAFYSNQSASKNYMMAPDTDGGPFRFGYNHAGIYLYEKVYDDNSSFEWVIADELINGEEFALVSVNNGTGKIFNCDGTVSTVSVSGNRIVSEVPTTSTWSAYINSDINGTNAVSGQKGFWLVANYLIASTAAQPQYINIRPFLITHENNVNTTYPHSSVIGNYYATNLCNYTWNYENGKLISAHINKAQVVGATNDATKSVGFSGDALTTDGTGTVYIFKKTYHEHNYVETNRIDATCTTAGEVTYICECTATKTDVIGALGHVTGALSSVDRDFHGYTCTRCSELVKSAHTITYEDDDAVYHERICLYCDYHETEKHTLDVTTVDPSCVHGTITVSHCNYCGFHDESDDGDFSGHLNNPGSVLIPASCTTEGTLKYTCLVCGDASGTGTIEAHGHMYSDWYNKNATTRVKKCLHCGDEITENYSNYTTDYVYGLVDYPTSGRDYIIANTAYTGNGFAAASPNYVDSSNETIVSTPIIINGKDSASPVPYIKPNSVGENILWTAEANGNKFAFKNIGTNEYLWARTMTSESCPEWIHNNIGSSTNLSDYLFSAVTASGAGGSGEAIISGLGTELIAPTGIRVGFEENIYSNGFTIPGKNALRFQPGDFHYPIVGFVNPDGNVIRHESDLFPDITGNLTIDFDMHFTSPDCCIILYKPDYTNGLYGQRIEILGGSYNTDPNGGTCVNFVTNTINPNGSLNNDAYVYGINLNDPKFDGTDIDNGLIWGENTWHHIRIICDETSNSTELYIDNVLVAKVDGWIFKSPVINDADGVVSNKHSHKGIYMLSWISKAGNPVHTQSGMPMRFIQYGSDNGDWNVWVDNLNIKSERAHIYDDYDDTRNAVYGVESNITAEFVNVVDPTVVSPELIAQNVFVADNDVSNKVYLYEKMYKYDIEYYYDGIKDDSLTETGYRSIGASVTYSDKAKLGYIFDKASPAGTITVGENTANNVIKVYYVSAGSANNDSYAVSFSKTAIPAAYFAENDTIRNSVTNYTLSGIASAINGSVNTIYTSSIVNNAVVNSNGVTVTLENGNVIVNSTNTTDINVDFYLQYSFTLNGQTAYIYSSAKLISATSIYFEDNAGLINYAGGTLQNGGNYGWEKVGSGSVPTALYNDVYGYSGTYNNVANIQYSAGSSYKLTMPERPDYENEAYASFIFNGTGFDVISHADSTAGIVFVDVYNVVNGNRTGDAVRSYFVNNYLGYTYNGEEWLPTDSADVIWQVPVIKVVDLPFGTYEAVITPTYARDFKDRTEGTTNFYLDAVRIYTPMGDNDTFNSVYASAGQCAPTYYDVGELIIDSSNENWNAGCEGVMYITSKGSTAEASDYVKFGPNHEVYLENTDYISFYLTSDTAAAKVAIGASAIGSTATVKAAHGTTYKQYTLNAGTDMYYPIDVEWTFENGVFRSELITITASSGLVSVTDIRCTSDAVASAELSFNVYSASAMETKVENVIEILNTILGDVNGDNAVNALDSLIAKLYVSGSAELTETQLYALDLNGDGVVNSKDVLKLKLLILGK